MLNVQFVESLQTAEVVSVVVIGFAKIIFIDIGIVRRVSNAT